MPRQGPSAMPVERSPHRRHHPLPAHAGRVAKIVPSALGNIAPRFRGDQVLRLSVSKASLEHALCARHQPKPVGFSSPPASPARQGRHRRPPERTRTAPPSRSTVDDFLLDGLDEEAIPRRAHRGRCQLDASQRPYASTRTRLEQLHQSVALSSVLMSRCGHSDDYRLPSSQLAKDHPPGHCLQHAGHGDLHGAVDVPPAFFHHDHRAVIQIAHALAQSPCLPG